MIQSPDIEELMPLLRAARDEDLGAGDITSAAVIAATARATGTFLAKEAGVLCGGVLLGPLARLYDRRLKVRMTRRDGLPVQRGRVVGRVAGPARAMLAFERVALNFVQRLSGIATATRAFVDAVDEVCRAGGPAGSLRAGGPAGSRTRCLILDTRKTTPGWRALEKYAVRCGGGTNHRAGLYDAILVKDNHIALAAGRTAEDLASLARRLRRQHPDTLIEIEVDTLAQLGALLAGAADAVDIVLLDNMTPAQLRRAVRMRNELGTKVIGSTLEVHAPSWPGRDPTERVPPIRPLLEASGRITLATVRAVARTGVERISVGAITHSARALDISLEMQKGKTEGTADERR